MHNKIFRAPWLDRKLILILGKGGVGKTQLSNAVARQLARSGKKTLLCHVLQVAPREQKIEKLENNLSEIYLRADQCFQEYVILKLKIKPLYTTFLNNRITQYLEKAAPGLKELVLFGKIWFECQNYDHVVVDMASTGYALTMLHTPFNFADLFPGGPVYHDALQMTETLKDSNQTACVALALAEEMPVQETLELSQHLANILPNNPPWIVMNRLIQVTPQENLLYESKWLQLSDQQKRSPLWLALDHRIQKARKQAELLSTLKSGLQIYEGEI